jgi:hypothetical protein
MKKAKKTAKKATLAGLDDHVARRGNTAAAAAAAAAVVATAASVTVIAAVTLTRVAIMVVEVGGVEEEA